MRLTSLVMKRFMQITLVLGTLSMPAFAQEEEPSEQGLSLMERGAQMFMEGMLGEMEPALEGFEDLARNMAPSLRNFANEMGPKLSEIFEQVEDWNAYQAPEMLPNGDIIIRRKPDHPLMPPDTPTEPEPQIDL